MGTNRRSRRRSAARILNSNSNAKRLRPTSNGSDDTNSVNFRTTNMTSTVFDVSYPQTVHNDTILDATTESVPANDTQFTIFCESPPTDATINREFPDSGASTLLVDSNVSPTFSQAEICSYELMTLLDNAGCPLNTYEQVITLLRKQEKLGFSYTKAHSREKLLKILREKFHCPTIESTVITNCDVFSFPFVDMLQDLVDTAGTMLHRISPDHSSIPTSDELWCTDWMKQTFLCPQHAQFDSTTDIMIPLILYVDKTGTDVLQRYSLEPMLFSLTVLKREAREDRRFWRHLGFVPSSKSRRSRRDRSIQ